MTLSLQVATRDAESRRELQAADKIPAVVYGPKQENISLQIDRGAFDQVFKESGESTIIALQGLDEDVEVLVHAVDFHPIKGGIEHVDFYAIERGKDITTHVPVVLTGDAPVEKGGGMVNQILHEVSVTCRPSNLPKELALDVSGLSEADMQLTVADLPVPEGVTIYHEAEEVVAVAQGAREEEPEEDAAEVDMDAIEVEEKGKGEAEDTEAQS